MTLSVEEKINLSNYRFEKAKESLNDSSLLFLIISEIYRDGDKIRIIPTMSK